MRGYPMKKKLLAVVVAVSIVFCMLPLGMVLSAADVAGVNASAAGACGPVGPDNGPLDTVIWTYVDGKLTVSGTGDMGNFTAETLPWAQYVPEISSIVVSEGVTSIGTGAFRNLPATALSVNLPSTVTAIYDDAFSGDAGLTSLKLPASLTYVGNSAFAGTGLTALALPDSVTFMGTGVFSEDASLSAVALPAGLPSISDYMFFDCPALNAVKLPENVAAIGSFAFSNSGLAAIDLPAAVTSVAGKAFYFCPSLTDVGTSSMNNVFAADAFDGSHAVTIHGPEGSEAGTFAASLAGLGLTYTTEPMPELVYPEIAADFVTVPASAQSMVDSAAALESASADTSASDAAIASALAASDGSGEAAASADTDAAAGAKAAPAFSTYAATGETITDMTGDASGAASVDTVTVLADADTASADIGAAGNESGVTWSYDASTKALSINGSGAMKDFALTTDVPWFNDRSSITSVTMDDRITTIGNNAFASMYALTSVKLPSSLTSIGSNAFNTDSALTAVPFDTLTSLKTIGSEAFAGTGLTAAALPVSVTSIGEGAFRDCLSLSSVTLPTGLTPISDDLFYNDGALTEIAIPASVTTIGASAFRNTGLKTVTIPEAVTTVDSSAFAGCKSLTSAVVKGKSVQFGLNVFPLNTTLTVESGSTAETYAKANKLSYTYANLPMTGIAVNIAAATMAPKSVVTLAVSLSPSGASDWKQTTWKSSDEKIATVVSNSDGTGTVTAVAAGTATITATATSTAGKTFTDTSTITVSAGAVPQVLKDATVVLGDQNAVVTGVDSKDTNIAAAAKAIDDKAKTGKLTIASGGGLTKAISTAQTNARTLEAVVKYLDENPPAAGEKVTLTVKPRFNIEVKAAGADSVTYDITPTYDVDVQVGTKTGKDVATKQAMPVSETVTMTLPLPSALAEKTSLYITHKLTNDSFKYYRGTVKDSVLTFENPDGFSEFAITVAKPDGYKGGGVNALKTIVYRLLNKISGDHLFTVGKEERDKVLSEGWEEEDGGISGYDEADADVTVLRLYNKWSGEHFLTNSEAERDALVATGQWAYEGVAWYGLSEGDTPIYRLLNPHGYHMYTKSEFERGFLTAFGWKDEGILCYENK